MYGEVLVDTICDLQVALQQIAPSFDDERSIAKNDLPTRYVWVLDDTSGALDVRTTGRKAKGQAKELQTDVWRVLVHCWGFDRSRPDDPKAHKAEALRLRRALITALNDCLPADGFEETGTRHKGGTSFSERGWVCIVEVNLMLPLYELDLTGGPSVGARLVRPTSVGFANEPPSPTGDGLLATGEDQS